MERKRKKEIIESTWSRGYPDDGTGVSTDDDRPPGNILIGGKFKEKKFFNKLTSFSRNWEPDNSNWTWDHFENASGQEDYDNYSRTLQTMRTLFPEETWDNVWKHMTQVGDKETTKGFAKAGQPHRTARTQLGKQPAIAAMPPEQIRVEEDDLVNKIEKLIM
jgi:hypothetical protein